MSQILNNVLKFSIFTAFVIRLHNLCNIFSEAKIILAILCNIAHL